MQIPSGDSFGNRSAQLKQTNIQGPSSNGSDLMKGAVDGFYKELKTSALLDADNELFDYQVGLDTASSQVAELFATGQIADKEMASTYQTLVDAIKPPNFDGLDRNSQKQYLLDQQKLSHKNKLGISLLIKNAGAARAGATAARTVEKLGELAYGGKVSASEAIHTLESNEVFQRSGAFGFGLDWAFQKQVSYQGLQSSYILGGIKDANDTGNIDQLKTLRTMLLEDNPEVNYLTPLIKNKYLKEIDASIDVNVGRSYGNTLVDGMNQQVERTGDLSAVNAYSLLNKMQASEMQDDVAVAQHVAKQLGVKFDQQQFNDNPQYTEQLKQTYFNQALDQYGSPTMAAISTQVGNGQMDRWLKEFGNPIKGQLSEAEFIHKIPDEKLKQTALKISEQEDSQFNVDDMLALVEGNKNLNDEQKRIAKAQIRQSAENLQRQQQLAYREKHQSVWRDLYVNHVPLGEIDPQLINSLKKSDQIALLEKPVIQLDLSVLGEARGRLKAGEEFDVLKDYSTRLPINSLDKLLSLQQELIDNPEKKEALTTMNALVSSRSGLLGIQDKQRVSQLNDAVTEELDDFELSKGRKATAQERRDITDRHILQAKLDEPFYLKQKQTVTRDKRSSDIEKISTQSKQRISGELKAAGIAVTDENILSVYKGVKDVG